jgi:hypothetical protein
LLRQRIRRVIDRLLAFNHSQITKSIPALPVSLRVVLAPVIAWLLMRQFAVFAGWL